MKRWSLSSLGSNLKKKFSKPKSIDKKVEEIKDNEFLKDLEDYKKKLYSILLLIKFLNSKKETNIKKYKRKITELGPESGFDNTIFYKLLNDFYTKIRENEKENEKENKDEVEIKFFNYVNYFFRNDDEVKPETLQEQEILEKDAKLQEIDIEAYSTLLDEYLEYPASPGTTSSRGKVYTKIVKILLGTKDEDEDNIISSMFEFDPKEVQRILQLEVEGYSDLGEEEKKVKKIKWEAKNRHKLGKLRWNNLAVDEKEKEFNALFDGVDESDKKKEEYTTLLKRIYIDSNNYTDSDPEDRRQGVVIRIERLIQAAHIILEIFDENPPAGGGKRKRKFSRKKKSKGKKGSRKLKR